MRHAFALFFAPFFALFLAVCMLAGCRTGDDAPQDATPAEDATPARDSLQSAGIVPAGDVPGQGLLPGGQTHVFDCTDSETGSAAGVVPVTFRVDSTAAWLWLPHDVRIEPVSMQHVRSASGARYEGTFDGESVVFWNQGQEARLEIGDTVYGSCVRDNYRSVWEKAKLDGVDFRAVGNEPGWLVDIYSGDRFDVQWRYGERTAVLPYTEPNLDGDAAQDSVTVFRSQTADHTFEMTIVGGGCTDSMSGHEFAASVTIVIDGSEYTGCGRPLH